MLGLWFRLICRRCCFFLQTILLDWHWNRDGTVKFQVAAEVRDNVVAAGQNLLGAHQNLYVNLYVISTLRPGVRCVLIEKNRLLI